MSRTGRAARWAAVAALVAATVTACGDEVAPDRAREGHTDAPAAAADGDWLLRFTTAEGPDGERSRAILVRYDPATGAASSRTLPPVTSVDAGQDEQVLLVSADHAWALPDTGVPGTQARTGRLVLYSVAGDTTRTVDIRAVTGKPALRAVAWAFDPADADVLRVVDSDHTVWKVDLASSTATRETTLRTGGGWIYANGFDKLTGAPYVERIDSEDTRPPGNGDADLRPVERQGGTLVRVDGETLDGLPQPPCGFAGGFRFDGGVAWLFCADTPSITAYQAHPGGASWHAVGRPSPKIVPETAAELSFVLPPVG